MEKINYLQVLGLTQRPPDKATSREARTAAWVWFLQKQEVNRRLNPRNALCVAMEDIAPKAKDRAKTVLVTDGAPAYVALARQFGLAHLSCDHSQGEFNVVKRRGHSRHWMSTQVPYRSI